MAQLAPPPPNTIRGRQVQNTLLSTDLLISVLGDEVEGGLRGEEAGDEGQHRDHWQGVLHIHF